MVAKAQEDGDLPANAEIRFDGEGEWFITRRVFRDLGLALGVAVLAILLIDFTQNMEKEGRSVRDALLRAGALRVRPILLTAGAAMLAVVPIAFDPVFSSLAWSLIFGLMVSTVFTLLLVPVLYHLIYERAHRR